MIRARTNLELVRAAMQSHIARRKRRNRLASIIGAAVALTVVSAITSQPDQRPALLTQITQ